MNFYEQIFSRGRATGEGMTHFERLFAAKFGGSPPPEVREYTGSVPVTITADGTPLLDYLITGNTTQSGTPTPDNPVMPNGTGERTGNLIPEYPAQTKTLDGVNWNVSSNGKITGNGATTSGTNFHLLSNYSIPLKAGTYTLTFVGRKNISLILRNVTTMTTICAIWPSNSSTTFTIDNDIPETDRINLYFNTSQAGVSVDIDGYPMLNTGSTALPYEPFGVKIPISSANTTTPVYLGEVETTRRIEKLVLDGTESWSNAGGNAPYRLPIKDIAISSSTTSIEWYCSHYQSLSTNDSWATYDYCVSRMSTTAQSLQFRDVTKGDITAFKQYLAAQYAAGTPVTIWYILATETTGIVNEPLMRIGDYADTLSKTQAGVEIPTNNGSTTVDVDTVVKPSEVYLKYMG